MIIETSFNRVGVKLQPRETGSEIFADRHPGQSRFALKHRCRTELLFGVGTSVVGPVDGAAELSVKAGENAKYRTLSAAGGAEDRKPFAAYDIDRK